MSAVYAPAITGGVTIAEIPGANHTTWWQYISKVIKAAEKGSIGLEGIGELYLQWCSGDVRCLIASDGDDVQGACFVRYARYGKAHALWIVALAGRAPSDDWLGAMLDRIRLMQKNYTDPRMGKPRIIMQSSRRAMAKRAPKFGFKPIATVWEMMI